MGFKEISLKELSFNPFTKISKEWFLVSSGDAEKFNTMTASWGELGHIWHRDVVTVFIRPQRYTKEFIDRKETFTISFLPETQRKALNYLGTVSGRNEDKIAKSGLTPVTVGGEWSFEEAEMVFVCRKLYQSVLKPENFKDATFSEKFYPDQDFHEVYVAEIIGVYTKEN